MKAIFKNSLVEMLLFFLFVFAVCEQLNLEQKNNYSSNDSQRISNCIFAPANPFFLLDSTGKRRDAKNDFQYTPVSFSGDEYISNDFFLYYTHNTLLPNKIAATPIPPSAPRASPVESKKS